jgi:hypothetical protein
MSASPSFPPPPLEPLQVIPIYATPTRARPGIITLIGVSAIVVASISFFASGTVGMIALGMMIQTQVANTMATATANTRMTARVTVGSGNVVVTSSATRSNAPTTSNVVQSKFNTGPRGLDPQRRANAIDFLVAQHQLTDAQRERLDQLLAKAGKDIFANEVTRNSNPNLITESGNLPLADGSAAVYYVIPSGKLEIYDDRAIFAPGDGPVVRVRADDPLEDEITNALRPAQIDALLNTAQNQTGDKLTPAQLATLKRELSDPDQQVVITGGNNAPMLYATMMPDNSVSIAGNGFLQIDPNGNVINSTAQMMTAMSKFSVRGAATAMTLLDAILSIGLSIYLLVVGILILKQNRRGRGMLTGYALLKIPVAVLAAIGWMWTIQDANAGTLPPGLVQFWLWMFLAIGLAYPIILLIVVQTRTVREYYNAVRTA